MKATRTAIVRKKQQQKAFNKEMIVGRKKTTFNIIDECFTGFIPQMFFTPMKDDKHLSPWESSLRKTPSN